MAATRHGEECGYQHRPNAGAGKKTAISTRALPNFDVGIRILGVNKTAAVEIALDYYLEHHSAKQDDNATRREAARLLDELPELPVLDDREPDEILGYDENGLV